MEKEQETPKMKKPAKTPVIMQMEALECGAACLCMIAAYHGKWLPLEQVRKDCGVSRDGSLATNVLVAGRTYGLESKGFRYDIKHLKTKISFPCIIHWDFVHFVVLNGFQGKKVSINDPARGRILISEDEFDKGFTGICLTFAPTETFAKEGKPKSMISFIKERMEHKKQSMVLVLILTILASFLSLLSPVFSRVFLDRILSGANPSWLQPFLWLLCCIGLAQVAVAWVKTKIMLKIQGKFAVVSNATFIWHLLRLPVEFFSQRSPGDVASRQTLNQSIGSTFMNTLTPLVLDVVLILVYLVLMVQYQWFLALVGISGVVVNLLFSLYITKQRVNLTRVQQRDHANLVNWGISGIDMIESLKSSGAEEGFFQKWAGYQGKVNHGKVSFEQFRLYGEVIPLFMTSLVNTLILGLGIYYTMQGEFTLGMLLAFQGFVSEFQKPAETLLTANQTIQEMRSNMERVEDVLNYPTDVGDTPMEVEGEYEKLSGSVTLNHVTFGYSALAEPLVKDFSMHLEPGKSIALVGGSGSGKSTLSKLISGLYTPWQGEILFDGKKREEIPREILTGSLAVVDQDIVLFMDSINENLKMWDKSIEDFEVILASRDAQIHDVIMSHEMGYHHKMKDGGIDFSGGERQRLEIARVLAQDPTLVILDEATSALDAQTEYNVVKSIKERGISTIIIAHRLSTIRDCDEILLLEGGVVVERGDHNSLMAQNGKYKKLVTSE